MIYLGGLSLGFLIHWRLPLPIVPAEPSSSQCLSLAQSEIRGYSSELARLYTVVMPRLMVAMEVQEVASGAKERAVRQGLIDAAKRREVDAIVVWRLDRWGCSLLFLVTTLRDLTAVDVGFVSLSEALDLTTPSRRELWPACSPFSPNSNATSSANG